MAQTDTSSFINSIANLIGAIAWPGAVVVVALLFRQRLSELLSEIRERVKSSDVTVKAGPSGFELSTVAQSAAQLGAAVATHTDQPGDTEAAVAASANAVASLAAIRPSRSVPRILWVDDRPQNNVYETRAFEALGFTVLNATSTEQALDMLEHQEFDVVISDMGRPPDPRAGYTLLDSLRRAGNATPFIIYAGSNLPEHKAEARNHGALGSTNSPSELVSLVQQALGTS